MIQLPLVSFSQDRQQKNSRYKVCLDSLHLQKPPEGVYEVYLSSGTVPTSDQRPDKVHFVGVIDTYRLAASKQPIRLCISLHEVNAVDLHVAKPAYIVSILFRGNRLPDGRSAPEAGVLTGGRIYLQMTN